METRALKEIDAIAEFSELEEFRIRYLGKKGQLTRFVKQIGRLAPEERPAMGKLANRIKKELSDRFEQAKAALRQAEAQRLDVQVAQQEEEAAEAAVAQAKASLASAQASAREVQVREKDLQQARAALQQAKAELERARKLRLQVEARRKDVAAAQASLSQAVARLEEVAYNREYTRVVAPRDGIILDKLLEDATCLSAVRSTSNQDYREFSLHDVVERLLYYFQVSSRRISRFIEERRKRFSVAFLRHNV